MYNQTFVVQDVKSGAVSEILSAIMRIADLCKFKRLRVAVAYASLAGCKDIIDGFETHLKQWNDVTKKWLISIDFGRTEARALEFLRDLPNSEVRVPSGSNLLTSKLIPNRCFHAKTLIFDGNRKSSDGNFGLFTGSANLTLSGLHTGAEHAVGLVWIPPLSEGERRNLQNVEKILAWWDITWNQSDNATKKFLAEYSKICPKSSKEDDAETVRSFASSDVVVKPLKAIPWSQARCLWSETYELYKNRGKNRPGNQLDFPRGTRVYFGFPPTDVTINTIFGNVVLQYDDKPLVKRSVRFGHNYMDKVNLPVPGESAPSSYDNTYVHFERMGQKRFKITLSTNNEQKIWRKKSEKQGMLYEMSGGRQYGFYS